MSPMLARVSAKAAVLGTVQRLGVWGRERYDGLCLFDRGIVHGLGPDITADGVDLIEIDRPTGLAEIANLGLTLSEAKQVLARMQRALVAAQAHDHAVQRPGCSSCNGICHIKDWRPHQIATLFGGVTVRLPRWLCTGCRRIETGMRWPSHCRSSPELDQLQAHLSALMSYRVAA